jgi:hypothetical protein
MSPLVSDMIHPDPQKRSDMKSVVKQFDLIKASLSRCKLRSRVVKLWDVFDHGYNPPGVTSREYWWHRITNAIDCQPVIPT